MSLFGCGHSNHTGWREEGSFTGAITCDDDGRIHRTKCYEMVAYCRDCGQKLVQENHFRTVEVPTKTRITL